MGSISVNFRQEIHDLKSLLARLKTGGNGNFRGRSQSKMMLEMIRQWINSDSGKQELLTAGFTEDEIQELRDSVDDPNW